MGWATARLRVGQASGDVVGAAEVARGAVAVADWRHRAPVLIAPLVEALLAVADHLDAAALVEGVTETSNPWLLYAGGLVAFDGDDPDEAVTLLTLAASQFDDTGYALDEIRARLALAAGLTRLGRGDGAVAAASRAERLAQSCGAVVLARQAARAQTAAAAPGTAPATAPAATLRRRRS